MGVNVRALGVIKMFFCFAIRAKQLEKSLCTGVLAFRIVMFTKVCVRTIQSMVEKERRNLG